MINSALVLVLFPMTRKGTIVRVLCRNCHWTSQLRESSAETLLTLTCLIYDCFRVSLSGMTAGWGSRWSWVESWGSWVLSSIDVSLVDPGHPDMVSQVGPHHFYPRWSLFSLVRVLLLDLLPVSDCNLLACPRAYATMSDYFKCLRSCGLLTAASHGSLNSTLKTTSAWLVTTSNLTWSLVMISGRKTSFSLISTYSFQS